MAQILGEKKLEGNEKADEAVSEALTKMFPEGTEEDLKRKANDDIYNARINQLKYNNEQNRLTKEEWLKAGKIKKSSRIKKEPQAESDPREFGEGILDEVKPEPEAVPGQTPEVVVETGDGEIENNLAAMSVMHEKLQAAKAENPNLLENEKIKDLLDQAEIVYHQLNESDLEGDAKIDAKNYFEKKDGRKVFEGKDGKAKLIETVKDVYARIDQIKAKKEALTDQEKKDRKMHAYIEKAWKKYLAGDQAEKLKTRYEKNPEKEETDKLNFVALLARKRFKNIVLNSEVHFVEIAINENVKIDSQIRELDEQDKQFKDFYIAEVDEAKAVAQNPFSADKEKFEKAQAAMDSIVSPEKKKQKIKKPEAPKSLKLDSVSAEQQEIDRLKAEILDDAAVVEKTESEQKPSRTGIMGEVDGMVAEMKRGAKVVTSKASYVDVLENSKSSVKEAGEEIDKVVKVSSAWSWLKGLFGGKKKETVVEENKPENAREENKPEKESVKWAKTPAEKLEEALEEPGVENNDVIKGIAERLGLSPFSTITEIANTLFENSFTNSVKKDTAGKILKEIGMQSLDLFSNSEDIKKKLEAIANK